MPNMFYIIQETRYIRMNNHDSKGILMHKGSLAEAKPHHVINIVDNFGTPI